MHLCPRGSCAPVWLLFAQTQPHRHISLDSVCQDRGGWPAPLCLVPSRQRSKSPSPDAHGPLGAACPTSAQKSPGGQGRHQLTSGAPLSAFQVPTGQGLCLGFSVPAGQKWPGGQRSPKGSPSWRNRGLLKSRTRRLSLPDSPLVLPDPSLRKPARLHLATPVRAHVLTLTHTSPGNSSGRLTLQKIKQTLVLNSPNHSSSLFAKSIDTQLQLCKVYLFLSINHLSIIYVST